ncbi:hypothetical protein [Muriicola soli]|uniref:Uncharacterized protein n=1 Tax=Muriicola soli TaxID=2507538 RepID=A0A411E999_9FLAO|nr:hypothetical protein [Muriicola soli]QBA64296.1 hypothetical protein EQY75_06990 [Muriicola soli]
MIPKRHYTLLILFLLGISFYAEAQVGAMGRRRIVPQTQTAPAKTEPMTAEELVEAEMPKLLESIDFSEFEQAILKSILTKYVQQRIEIQILQLSPEKTREAYEQINLSQDEELKASLPEDKYEALKAYRERGGKKAKTKKRKKKKGT